MCGEYHCFPSVGSIWHFPEIDSQGYGVVSFFFINRFDLLVFYNDLCSYVFEGYLSDVLVAVCQPNRSCKEFFSIFWKNLVISLSLLLVCFLNSLIEM